jgi:hypothetical protein
LKVERDLNVLTVRGRGRRGRRGERKKKKKREGGATVVPPRPTQKFLLGEK